MNSGNLSNYNILNMTGKPESGIPTVPHTPLIEVVIHALSSINQHKTPWIYVINFFMLATL